MLKHDPTIRLDKIWEDFEEKGLCPHIKNLEDYREHFKENARNAEDIIQNWISPIVDPKKIRELHGILYKDIYPWAGTFREHNLPCRGRDGAMPENIQEELEMLQFQMKTLLAETHSKIALYRIAAFQHARLTTIQAFGDGNTRMSRAITENFLRSHTSKDRIEEMEKPDYLEALEAALGQENLAPLAGIFRKIYGESPEKAKWSPSPFQTTNQIEPINERTLGKTVRQRPEILDEEIATKANFLARWPWNKVVDTVGGKPTDSIRECAQIWDELRNEEQTLPQIKEIIDLLERKKPLKGSLFGEKPSWGTLRSLVPPRGIELRDHSKKDTNLEI